MIEYWVNSAVYDLSRFSKDNYTYFDFYSKKYNNYIYIHHRYYFNDNVYKYKCINNLKYGINFSIKIK